MPLHEGIRKVRCASEDRARKVSRSDRDLPLEIRCASRRRATVVPVVQGVKSGCPGRSSQAVPVVPVVPGRSVPVVPVVPFPRQNVDLTDERRPKLNAGRKQCLGYPRCNPNTLAASEPPPGRISS